MKTNQDHSQLSQNLWTDTRYYDKIQQTDDLSHPGITAIVQALARAESVLDVGAGDGRKINLLGKESALRIGTEVGLSVIKRQHYYAGALAHGEGLPFKSNCFEAVASFFVIEHVADPQQVLSEMIRILRPSGYLCLLAPNYGAPNRCSPNYQGSRLKKLVIGLGSDLMPTANLNWNLVTPKSQSMDQFESDWDTTVEPYLLSLERFVRAQGVTTITANSQWRMELDQPNRLQRVFRQLASWQIFPFTYWGPHMLYIGQKQV